MPWDAIFALSGDDGRGVVWPNEVPGEVAPQFGVAGKPAAPPTPAKVPHLRAVKEMKETPKKAAAKSTAPRARKRSKKGAALADTKVRSAPKSSPMLEATAAEAQPRAEPLVEASKSLPLGEPPRKRELPPYLRIVK
jgi:hypothetical protein